MQEVDGLKCVYGGIYAGGKYTQIHCSVVGFFFLCGAHKMFPSQILLPHFPVEDVHLCAPIYHMMHVGRGGGGVDGLEWSNYYAGRVTVHGEGAGVVVAANLTI